MALYLALLLGCHETLFLPTKQIYTQLLKTGSLYNAIQDDEYGIDEYSVDALQLW